MLKSLGAVGHLHACLNLMNRSDSRNLLAILKYDPVHSISVDLLPEKQLGWPRISAAQKTHRKAAAGRRESTPLWLSTSSSKLWRRCLSCSCSEAVMLPPQCLGKALASLQWLGYISGRQRTVGHSQARCNTYAVLNKATGLLSGSEEKHSRLCKRAARLRCASPDASTSSSSSDTASWLSFWLCGVAGPASSKLHGALCPILPQKLLELLAELT